MQPDIIIKNFKNKKDIILDAKWKNIESKKTKHPSAEDLRQLYTYSHYYDAEKVALLYPGSEYQQKTGHYFDEKTGCLGKRECSVMTFSVNQNMNAWQDEICKTLTAWLEN